MVLRPEADDDRVVGRGPLAQVLDDRIDDRVGRDRSRQAAQDSRQRIRFLTPAALEIPQRALLEHDRHGRQAEQRDADHGQEIAANQRGEDRDQPEPAEAGCEQPGAEDRSGGHVERESRATAGSADPRGACRKARRRRTRVALLARSRRRPNSHGLKDGWRRPDRPAAGSSGVPDRHGHRIVRGPACNVHSPGTGRLSATAAGCARTRSRIDPSVNAGPIPGGVRATAPSATRTSGPADARNCGGVTRDPNHPVFAAR